MKRIGYQAFGELRFCIPRCCGYQALFVPEAVSTLTSHLVVDAVSIVAVFHLTEEKNIRTARFRFYRDRFITARGTLRALLA